MSSLSTKAVTAASNFARRLGGTLDSLGSKLEVAKVGEKLVPSTRFVAYENSLPSATGAFVAPTASLIGDVVLEKGASVWYGAAVRGDVSSVKIGERSSIGDRAIIHVAKIQTDDGEPVPTIIGNGVSVGPNAIIHAATIMDNVKIGACAQVLDRSVVNDNAVVADGAVVTPGTVIGSGELWVGSPAKMQRMLTEEEIASNVAKCEEIMELAAVHSSECAKTFEDVKEDEEEYYDKLYRDPAGFQPMPKDKIKADGDVMQQGVPGRIFNTTLDGDDSKKMCRT